MGSRFLRVSPRAWAIGLSLALLASCSGGGAAIDDGPSACSGESNNVMCLERCSLGCRGTACEVTEIAQNETLVFLFSRAIDPASVNNTTIQLRTSSGIPPDGQFLVNGALIEFRPDVLVVGGQPFFGFRSGETYTLTMPGGPNEGLALRSTSGDPLEATISCTLNVSRGVTDVNASPPRASIVAPRSSENVPLDAIIRIEFDEMIDVAAFNGGLSPSSPLQFNIRPAIVENGALVCALAPPAPLGGTLAATNDIGLGRSFVTFVPSGPLPGNACVQVVITDRVRDLAGVPATVTQFQFKTMQVPPREVSVVETFDRDDFLDRDASGGEWADGQATFAEIGGDARHGAFDARIASRSLGTVAGRRTFEIDTSNTVIPAELSPTGQSITITDGRYFFSEMNVPVDMRLVFVGDAPPTFTVLGRLQIDGEIDIRGGSVEYDDSTDQNLNAGDPGGSAGVFAGAGGQGGDRCLGLGALPRFNGRDGGDCRVPAGHAFAALVDATGGAGSAMFPASGLNGDVTAAIQRESAVVTLQAAAGGAGGSLLRRGQDGRVVTNSWLDPQSGMAPQPGAMGPPAVAGGLLSLLPVPAGTRSSLHLLVGGSGGGGGGSHPAFTLARNNELWARGSGGGGGGGAIALRAGDSLLIGPGASILASGGSAGISPTSTAFRPRPAPGGGGSGGSIILQSWRIASVAGTIDVRGGSGGRLSRNGAAALTPASLDTAGGDGSRGLARLELPDAPSPIELPALQPPATIENVGQLTERDDRSGFTSLFYPTRSALAPEYVRYEIRATVDGQELLFSDDPAIGVQARFGSAPIEASWQAGTMDQQTGLVEPRSLLPWRPSVGRIPGQESLWSDRQNSFRFRILIDLTSGQTVVIQNVRVVYRS